MSGNFQLRKVNSIEYYEIPSFSATNLVFHGFSTAIGGVSKGNFSGLNLAFHTGDNREDVLKNRNLFSQVFGINSAKLVCGEQVHGENIMTVTKEHIGKGAKDPEESFKATDALITNEKDVPLISFYADCVPVFFLDPVKKVIGLAHAGWKGTVVKIGAKTVKRMEAEFGSKPKDILVAIGPSIGPCHYEVDMPVIMKFKEAFPTNWQQILDINDNEKGKLDLWNANVLQLIDVGIPKENITVAQICTACNSKSLYSYRMQGLTGRMASLIMLKEDVN